MSEDEKWMSLAIAEARRGMGKTAPNPPVGAVIVKNGALLGKGWHRRAGQPHAEREAIADVVRAHGAAALVGTTAYVTLEPCSTQGRTPPCVNGLIEAGVARVVYACEDPNPAHAGRADHLLQQAGIAVESGVMREEAWHILRPFAKVQQTGLPWVMVKTAMSLDGRITRPEGEPMWLSGETSRADVQVLRSEVDAMLTSGETVRRDHPALTIRRADLLEGRLQPWRVVMTRRPETLPMTAPLFADDSRERTLIRSGDPATVLRDLVKNQGVLSVMVEAGGKLVADLFAAGLVDEVVVYLAPMIAGGVPAFAGMQDLMLSLEQAEWTVLGDDVRLRALVKATHSGK